jgi:hypothetical protein
MFNPYFMSTRRATEDAKRLAKVYAQRPRRSATAGCEADVETFQGKDEVGSDGMYGGGARAPAWQRSEALQRAFPREIREAQRGLGGLMRSCLGTGLALCVFGEGLQ